MKQDKSHIWSPNEFKQSNQLSTMTLRPCIWSFNHISTWFIECQISVCDNETSCCENHRQSIISVIIGEMGNIECGIVFTILLLRSLTIEDTAFHIMYVTWVRFVSSYVTIWGTEILSIYEMSQFHRAGLNRGVPMGQSTQIMGGSFRQGLNSEATF